MKLKTYHTKRRGKKMKVRKPNVALTPKKQRGRIYPHIMPPKQRHLPATQGYVHARLEKTEARLKVTELRLESEIRTVESNLRQEVREVREIEDRLQAQIYGNGRRVEEKLTEKIENLELKLESKMDQRFAEMGEKLSQILVLVEEQSTRTRMALEHTIGLAQAQARLEGRMDACEDLVRAATGRKTPVV